MREYGRVEEKNGVAVVFSLDEDAVTPNKKNEYNEVQNSLFSWSCAKLNGHVKQGVTESPIVCPSTIFKGEDATWEVSQVFPKFVFPKFFKISSHPHP